MTVVRITLPWPDKALSPNARVHWAAAAKKKSKARNDGYYAACEAMAFRLHWAESIEYRVTAHPKDYRRRDQDNLLASLKSYCDGIADCIRIDDSKWTCAGITMAEKRNPPCVIVELRAL
jgi:crossover junction endodeoxyribonuclease RusA